MCGIIGYIGSRAATDVLIQGLRRLEYRGYDSAGIAVVNGHGVDIRRVEGKLGQLEAAVREHPPVGTVGMGHTRWATHGRPSETNAHPHRSGDIVVVHNGIIENHGELKEFLLGHGHHFESETDTEVICHLVHHYVKEGEETFAAVRHALALLRGSYALVILNAADSTRLYVAKHGSPLVSGIIDGQEAFIASDIPAILPYTNRMVFLEDGDVGVMTAGNLELYDATGASLKRVPQFIPWSPLQAERGGYKHFMLKEIFEQPDASEDALIGRIHATKRSVTVKEMDDLCGGTETFPFDEMVIVACGTSLHAGMVGKYIIEALSGVRVSVDVASEFRYRHPIVGERSLVIPITQSGETADTIAAVQMMKEAGARSLAICNALGSSITRLADATVYTHAGPEIGVASTKAFTTQLVILYLLALDIAQRRGRLDRAAMATHVASLVTVPRFLKQLLAQAKVIKRVAEKVSHADHVLYIGRGAQYPVALEGALKLKEISYLHAEGFAAGELKHGPIALIDEGVPVVAICLRDAVYEKMLSNIEEVRARGANVIALTTAGDQTLTEKVERVIEIPAIHWALAPILVSIPLQLLAYYVADHKGTDVDQPRNLAKSVTVE